MFVRGLSEEIERGREREREKKSEKRLGCQLGIVGLLLLFDSDAICNITLIDVIFSFKFIALLLFLVWSNRYNRNKFEFSLFCLAIY